MLPAGRPPGAACIPVVTESGWEVPCAKRGWLGAGKPICREKEGLMFNREASVM